MELYMTLEPSPMAPYKEPTAESCEMCGSDILTMCFKSTGVCGEQCRKLRNNQLVIEEVARGAA